MRFNGLLTWLNAKIDGKNVKTMKAAELSMDLRDSMYIIENVGEYVFGYHRKLDEVRQSQVEGNEEKDESDTN